MHWLAQLLGVTLALTLNLGVPMPDGVEPSTSGSHVRTDAHWVKTLRDKSLPVEERLELVASDRSFSEWMTHALEHAPRVTVPDPSVLEVSLDGDPILLKLREGVRAMMTGLAVISERALEEVSQPQAEGMGRLEELTDVLTDPQIPDIVGDEMASFLEGLAAGIGAVIIRDDLELSEALATVFASRMQRVPRMFVLTFVGCERESYLRDGWQSYVSQSDLETLSRDVEAANSYAHDLRRLSCSKSVA